MDVLTGEPGLPPLTAAQHRELDSVHVEGDRLTHTKAVRHIHAQLPFDGSWVSTSTLGRVAGQWWRQLAWKKQRGVKLGRHHPSLFDVRTVDGNMELRRAGLAPMPDPGVHKAAIPRATPAVAPSARPTARGHRGTSGSSALAGASRGDHRPRRGRRHGRGRGRGRQPSAAPGTAPASRATGTGTGAGAAGAGAGSGAGARRGASGAPALMSPVHRDIYAPADAPKILVDTIDGLATALEDLKRFATLSVDLEGVNLGREGGSLVFLCACGCQGVAAAAGDKVGATYAIDLVALGGGGASAATSALARTAGGTSLKQLLQSPTVTKLFWDVRQDSRALYACDVRMEAVFDVQVAAINFKARPRRDGRIKLPGLGRTLEAQGLPFDMDEKKLMHARFDAWRDGSLMLEEHPMLERPVSGGLLDYMAGDVCWLPTMIHRFRLSEAQTERVLRHSNSLQRAKEVCASRFVKQGPHRGFFEGWCEGVAGKLYTPASWPRD